MELYLCLYEIVPI